MEDFIDGKFTKYINNTSDSCLDAETNVMAQKAHCLTHFSFEKSGKKSFWWTYKEVVLNYLILRLLLRTEVLYYFTVLVTCPG